MEPITYTRINNEIDTVPLRFPKSPTNNKRQTNDNYAQEEFPIIINKIQQNIQYDSSIPLSSSPISERFIHHLHSRLENY